jgi:hypothetical protein
MTRLITFGCSYPYGHGLPDCFDEKNSGYGIEPSKFSFPELIAQHCNFKNINLSRPGISNKGIVHTLQKFVFQKGDICLLAWTHIDRSSFITKDDEIKFIGPWQTDKLSTRYYKYFFEHHDNLWNMSMYVNYANLYLKNKDVTVINIRGYNADVNIDWNSLVDNDTIMTDHNVHSSVIDIALDNAHPGVETHKQFAKKITLDYNKILKEHLF